MKSKLVAGLLGLAVIVLGTYWYASPYLTLWNLRKAAERQDAEAFNASVDYPRLRASLKEQLSAMMDGKLQSGGARQADPASAGRAIGNLLGQAIANGLVDTMVRPEVVMRAMQQGRLNAQGSDDGSRAGTSTGTAAGSATGTAAGSDAKPKIQWEFERQNVNRLLVQGRRADSPDAAPISLVLERNGFADWKLVGIDLPAKSR